MCLKSLIVLQMNTSVHTFTQTFFKLYKKFIKCMCFKSLIVLQMNTSVMTLYVCS